MKKLLYILCLLILIGCTSNPTYLEGTSTSIGAYLPYNGLIYGLELIQYLNGIRVQASSNQVMTVERDHTASNNYCWGMVNTTESTHTTVSTEGGK